MRPNEQQVEEIRRLFGLMQSKEDFLDLLNYAKLVIYPNDKYPIELRSLNYYINPNIQRDQLTVVLNRIVEATGNSEGEKASRLTIRLLENSISKGHRYTSFTIPKKNGDERVITAPVNGLKRIQKALNLILQVMFQPHEAAFGFVLGRSILDNAKVHERSYYVFNIDLKDFFPSVEKARLFSLLKLPPFDLHSSPVRKKIANMISVLCCEEMEVERLENGEWVKKRLFVLPQGAPTSPAVTNMVCYKMDRRLAGLAKRHGLRYSRYADDITFSSFHNVYQEDGEFRQELHRIIEDQRFVINERKVRLQKQGYRQEVTGLVVNAQANIQRRYIKEIRKWLYVWERYGYNRLTQYFFLQHIGEDGTGKSAPVSPVIVLRGKLNYLRMVKGEAHPAYLSLKERYIRLVTQSGVKVGREVYLEKVLDVLCSEGLGAAMRIYIPQ